MLRTGCFILNGILHLLILLFMTHEPTYSNSNSSKNISIHFVVPNVKVVFDFQYVISSHLKSSKINCCRRKSLKIKNFMTTASAALYTIVPFAHFYGNFEVGLSSQWIKFDKTGSLGPFWSIFLFLFWSLWVLMGSLINQYKNCFYQTLCLQF